MHSIELEPNPPPAARRSTMRRLAVSLSVLCLFATPATGETSFQFSAAGAQAPEDPDVSGFRLVLFYGKNQSVSGFDLGIASLSEATNASGFSMIWGIGKVSGQSSGLASSFVNLHSGEDTSVNAAFINNVKTLKSGVNIGFVNVTDGYSNVDVSGMGISKKSKVQLGFVNITGEIESLQIGFLNFAENGIFPVMPFFNFPKKKTTPSH
jgi:hypothetical protein